MKIEQIKVKTKELCDRYNVERLDLFGSYAKVPKQLKVTLIFV